MKKCDCFENHNGIFLILKHIMKYVKASGKMLTVDQVMSIFL